MNTIKYFLYMTLIGVNLLPAAIYAMNAEENAQKSTGHAGSSTSSYSAEPAQVKPLQTYLDAIYDAVHSCRVDTMEKLLAQDRNCVNYVINKYGVEYSPLGKAVRAARPNMVEFLLNNGANIEIVPLEYNGQNYTNAYELARACRAQTTEPAYLIKDQDDVIELFEKHLNSKNETEKLVKVDEQKSGTVVQETTQVNSSSNWLTLKNMAITGTVTAVTIIAAAGYYFFGTQVDADEEEEQRQA